MTCGTNLVLNKLSNFLTEDLSMALGQFHRVFAFIFDPYKKISKSFGFCLRGTFE